MFPIIDDHGFIEHTDVTDGGLVAASSLIVYDLTGQIAVVPPCIEEATGEVDIFAVHEEIFVEQSHLVECLPAQHGEGSADHIDLRRF